MSEIYIKKLKYKLGSYTELDKLEQKKLIFSKPEEIRDFGYSGACIMNEKFHEGNRDIIIAEFLEQYNYDEIDEIIYNSSFIEYENNQKHEKDFMEVFMDYPLTRHLNKINKSINYWGITQQACNGLFKCIEFGRKELDFYENNRNILCISEDILPNGCYYDRPKQRMLFSDSLSGLILTKEKTNYELIDIKSIHVANDNYFIFVSELLKLIELICVCNGIKIDEIEKYFVPNFWNDTWETVFKQLYQDEKKHYINTIEKISHSLSADFIYNMFEYEGKKAFVKDKYYISISYGYGGNISVMLFKHIFNE